MNSVFTYRQIRQRCSSYTTTIVEYSARPYPPSEGKSIAQQAAQRSGATFRVSEGLLEMEGQRADYYLLNGLTFHLMIWAQTES